MKMFKVSLHSIPVTALYLSFKHKAILLLCGTIKYMRELVSSWSYKMVL